MCTFNQKYILTSIDEIDRDTLAPEQQAIFDTLSSVGRETQAQYSRRFKSFASGMRVTPGSKGAFRTELCALRWGMRLNSLHPDRDVADYWRGRLLESPDWLRFGELRIDGVGDVAREEFGRDRTVRRRERLKSLPHDFDHHALGGLEGSAPDLKFAFIFLALTGCRPGEVKSLVWRGTGETSGICTIQTEKVRAGPSARSFEFRQEDSPLGLYASELIQFLNRGAGMPFGHVGAKHLQNLCARISTKVFPKLSPGLNATCFRAKFAADLKADGIPRDKIAEAMGHGSERTASLYGMRSQGTAGRRKYLPQLCESQVDIPDDTSLCAAIEYDATPYIQRTRRP